MYEKKYKWYKIADALTDLQFEENSLLQIEVGGKKICIAKILNSITACAARCPHAGGDMSRGFIDKNGNIVCPIHRYAFNLNNGRETTGEGYYIKIYPVEIKEAGIFLRMEEGGLFSWLK